MYCSNCGNKVREGLNYCNQCGGKVQNAGSSENESVAKSLSTALGYIGFAGFGALVGLVAILLRRDSLEPAAIVAVVFFYLTALSAISFMILRQISNLAGSTNRTDKSVPNHEDPGQVYSAPANMLDEAKQRPASVVENTTRTLDKVPVERD